MRIRIYALFILALCLVLLTSCCPIPFGDPVCNYSLPAYAFNDLNGNAQRDTDEPAIENVRLTLAYTYEKDDDEPTLSVVPSLAGERELLRLGIGYCPITFEVTAAAPAGWAATTPQTVSFAGEPQGPAAFGYRWTGDAPPTPAPQGDVQCYQGFHLHENVTGWDFAPSGDLWVARDGTHGALLHVVDGVEMVVETDGFPRACGIAVDDGGVVWSGVCQGGGVIRFDGTTWHRYRVADGLLSDNVDRVTLASDGSVWAVGYEGVSRYDPQARTWRGLLELGTGRAFQTAADGSLWYLTTEELVQVDPRAPLPPLRRRPISRIADQPTLMAWAALTGDAGWVYGTFGRGGEPFLARYEFTMDRWTMFTYDSTGGALPLNRIRHISALADGSVLVQHERGAYRVAAPPADDPTAWRMTVYPRLAAENFPVELSNDLQLLQELTEVYRPGVNTPVYCRVD